MLADGHEMLSAVQVDPPSEVVRKFSTSALALELKPSATQLVVSEHEMPSKSPIPLGRSCATHFLPPLVVAATPPPAARKQVVADGQEIPRIKEMLEGVA
jgi:hypothetical protein